MEPRLANAKASRESQMGSHPGARLTRRGPLHGRWRSRAQTELPAYEKAKRAGQEGTPAGEAAASGYARGLCGRRDPARGDGSLYISRRRSNSRKRNVKLASRGATDTRQLRTDRLRRDRAAAEALRMALPTVQLLHLELRFDGCANAPTSQTHSLHPPARAFFVYPCPYSDCDGQFDLDGAVRAALADPSHRTEGKLECTGARTGERGPGQPCQLQLNYTVTATCRDDS
jgi:hypothetical protein